MRNKFLTPLVAALLVFGWMFFFFHDVFLHPNAHLFNEQGDGIKAFYAFADHIRNDESYHQFRNMNYPYGQTHIYTDGQTAIADIMKVLAHLTPFFQTHSIAIYNYLILFSFVFCGFFITCILQRYQLPLLFKIAGGFCIAILSPQIGRISGHPTMSYAFFFPLAWYLLLLAYDSGFNWKYVLAGLVNTTFWFFVHPYLGMIIVFFYCAFLVVTLTRRKGREYLTRRKFIALSALILLPVLFVKLYTFAFDHHTFRSEHPWGFWDFYTSPAQVFLPHGPPFGFLVDYYVADTQQWDMEKLAYVGLAVDFILVLALFRIFRHLLRRKYIRSVNPALPLNLNTSFWASVLVLLFAMCIPFKFGLQSLVEHVGFLRQFRALGRFAWAFYYVSAVYAVYLFFLASRFLKMKKLNLLANSMVFIFFSLFIVEAQADYRERSHWALMPKNLFNEHLLPGECKSLIDEVNKVKDSYQCIVTLPFYHVGTENFGIDFTLENIRISSLVSYWCNVPLLASSAARSPIIEGKNIMQFFSPGLMKKAIEKDLPSKKDFLILYDKEPLNDDEKRLLKKSRSLFDNGKYELLSVRYDSIFADNSADLIQQYASVKDSLLHNGIFETGGSADVLEYKSYDSLTCDITYKGSGALKSKKKDETVLYASAGKLTANQEYTVSFWYYNKDELRNQILCLLEECDADGNKCSWSSYWDPRKCMQIDGDWSLLEKKFTIKDSSERIRIFLKGYDNGDQDIYIDEFLLRPSHVDVYSKMKAGSESFLFYNNWWIPTAGLQP